MVVPVGAVLAIFARENGRGMQFPARGGRRRSAVTRPAPSRPAPGPERARISRSSSSSVGALRCRSPPVGSSGRKQRLAVGNRRLATPAYAAEVPL
ncbi:MAG: ClpXP protease specificity-enhancing factor SspB [Chromatiales bacterium]|nr:ClpXP protease specificity-enhancing factor SspB [Chromatiales bacterium]